MRIISLVVLLCVQLVIQSAPRIAVIGAGFAGLAAANRLVDKGYEVDVYEARERVGGRVFSVILQDLDGTQHVAELGAQSIRDGGAADHLRALIAEFDLRINDVTRPAGGLGYFDGERVSFPENMIKDYGFTPEMLWMYLAGLHDKARTMDDVLRMFFNDNSPLYKLFTLRLTCYEGGSPDKLSPVYIDTLYNMMLSNVIDDPEEPRLAHMESIAGGNGQLAEAIARKLGNRVHLGWPLMRIGKNESGRFTLYFTNRAAVKADIIILTIPCTVYNNIVFEEGIIPEEQLEAIRSIRYGGNAKILVPVVDPEPARTHGSYRAVAWRAGPGDPVTLYYREPYGEFTAETLNATIAEDIAVVELSYVSQKSLQQPCMARDESFGVYQGIVGHSWPLDPFARGSYSYINAGKEDLFMEKSFYAGKQIRTLFTPAGKLFFAGEHTTILTDVLGTMEAAVESGERVAEIIALEYPLK